MAVSSRSTRRSSATTHRSRRPPTIRQTLAAASDKYGIDLPLQDLFHWSEPGSKPALQSAMAVGDAVVDGVDTQQYAFRQGDYDWQIWIQKGDRPLPRKLVIVDRTDEARPAYSTKLNWNVQPALAADAFTFRPDKDAKAIKMSVTRAR